VTPEMVRAIGSLAFDVAIAAAIMIATWRFFK
jgi:hypothetical protein